MAFVKVLICLYFMMSESKDWHTMCYNGWVCSIISLTVTLKYLNESPRFLIAMDQYSEARTAMKLMNSKDDLIHCFKSTKSVERSKAA